MCGYIVLRPQMSLVGNAPHTVSLSIVEASWNVMAHAQKPDFVFRQNGGVHLNRRGRQFSRLPAAEVCASAVVVVDTPCSEVVWRVLATHSIRQFPLHVPSCVSPCAITFHLDSTYCNLMQSSHHDIQSMAGSADWHRQGGWDIILQYATHGTP